MYLVRVMNECEGWSWYGLDGMGWDGNEWDWKCFSMSMMRETMM